MNRSVRLHFSYEEADYVDFLRHYALKGKGRRFMWWVLIAVLFSLYMLYQDKQPEWQDFVGLLAMLVIFLGLWWFFMLRMGKRTYQQTPTMLESRTVAIDKNGVDVQGQTFTAQYTWPDINRAASTKRSVLLFTGPLSAVILPKSAFAAVDLADFEAFLAEQGLLKKK